MKFSFCTSITTVNAEQWNALIPGRYPFLRHEFIATLETSGSTTADTGWEPHHLLVHDDDDNLIALAPLYLKDHSYGEYVFDWAWADAYHRNNLEYYPKLLSAIPFTPATGPRFVIHPNVTHSNVGHPNVVHPKMNGAIEDTNLPIAMANAIIDEARRLGVSSWHCLFGDKALTSQLSEDGYLKRLGCQFHWYNQGFSHFDDFLSTFSSRKRKNLRKERQKVIEQGVTLVRKCGDSISEAEWEQFYTFYHLTYFKRSGHQGYLGPSFFPTLGKQMPEQLMMVQAYYEGRMVAAALNLFSDTHLYGRYWGCDEDFNALHFEACYYQGIEFAIERGLQVFDPGAQGEHKIQRGFTPTITYSNHWLADPRFHHAVAHFLEQETPGILAYRDETQTLLPFRKE
ncbi:GNAT family N-acetyltransferase [Marinibactrum halimedae]|uniref:N-acetyltransferase n=1 Tax=Marinibactrum halimedae TaxID=1444977 RepID=A0AA37TFZ6_9GAMM|nr:GNAT family N-acetyltransferase [Marinibactrum halimedae]MCD9459960.1 GNAT family N-acetyltransferase [Marinibactrum halimedae]GLS28272.1 hypothetical protein GCM10007877_39910 [Marinibactrum halimedae]